MNYPVWDAGAVGGGSVIALIAVLHVYIAHLAVGGGLFLWWLDHRALKTSDATLESFLERYNGVFLLVTAVFGAVTGVGIWFAISVVNPAGTSTLIHTFVFGWAIEWVFFVGEVVALAIYHYRFDTMPRTLRRRVAFFYFLFAWLSLVAIDGILSFMLTPGAWLEDPSFWTGFLNPGFLPSVLFRSFLAMLFAGVFGVLVGSFQADEALRRRVLRTCSSWILVGALGLVPTGFWYHSAVPAEVLGRSLALNPESAPWMVVFFVSAGVAALAALVARLGLRQLAQKGVAFLLVLAGLGVMAGFEYVREHARRPYVIQGHMYTNGILRTEVDALSERGVLASARWVRPGLREGGDEADRGEALFQLQCSACHTVGGRNDILAASEHLTYMGLQASLAGQGRLEGYMPPFVGTARERDALAAFIVGTLHGRAVVREPERVEPAGDGFAMPEPPPETDDDGYVLLAWNDLGMHCLTDADRWFSFLPPANTLEAQLIARGDPPELVTEGVTLHYEIEPAFSVPEKQVEFWSWAEKLYGKALPPGVGLAGKGVEGELDAREDGSGWTAHAIPAVPYRADGSYDAYPLVTIEARAEDGAVLARTKAVLPVGGEIGCRNCHGGPWRKPGGGGLSDETAREILRIHDERSGTSLLAEAEAGAPRLCQSCHADPAVGTEGRPELLNFSAAMHGWHANFMAEKGAQACGLCHPSLPMGRTRCQRGLHGRVGLDCVSCHGTLDEHALSLLVRESAEGKPGAARLAAHLQARSGLGDVAPRTPWVDEPDCLSCHMDFEKPAAGASSFNRWVAGKDELYRERKGEAGIRCVACHGAPHALYPVGNAFEPDIDNIQPLQYAKHPLPLGAAGSCTACHTEEIEDAVHHPNMEHPWRRTELWKAGER